ncbi:MAG: DNA polymerase IV [Chloroflexota bacterium]
MSVIGDLSAAQVWPQAVLHLDMDAFYVNVHLLDQAEDRGVPLVVGGRPHERGVVSSASYEARQLGIHSAMPTSTAVRLCPTLKIVPANWPRIRECSRQVMDILHAYGPLEQMSVDEAYVDVSEQVDVAALARAVQEAVLQQTRLPASVGLATSKLVAKVASDHEKPQGCTIVLPGAEAAFLAPLPTRVIWGIGPRTAEKLAQMGIMTCGQLAAAELASLYHQFGRQAEDLQRRARGIDNRPVVAEAGLPKSISQEWTFNQDVNDAALLRAQVQRMAEKVATAVQRHGLVAHTVRVKFRWADFTTFTRQKTVEVGFDDAETITRLALAIWEEHWPAGKRMRLIGVAATGLAAAQGRQLGFDFGSR